MSEPAELKVDDALDKLIHQFADPLSFYREVIQNALDAGSEEIEIYLTFEPAKEKGEPGVTIIHIDDWGVGMTREIIEKRLTRLFSSSKDGDRTKIGKFGIGFVSIFATDPELVCIDTSREGEHWRVLFTADRKFELRRRDHPVDGTKIRIYKRTTPKEHASLIKRSRETIRFWCKHTHGDIRFQDEPISEAFEIRAPITATHQDDASTIIVGHPPDGRSFFGLYNRGLTLLEGEDEHYPGLAFKVSSDLLEHTLTRDNVLQDHGYHRVLQLLEKLIRGPLADALFTALDEQHRAAADPARLRYLFQAAAWHVRRFGVLSDAAERTVVATTARGEEVTLKMLRKAFAGDAHPLVAHHPSALAKAVEKSGRLVLLTSPDDPLSALLTAYSESPPTPVGACYCLPMPADNADESERWRRLGAAVKALLSDYGGKLRDVEVSHFADPESTITGSIAITQRRFGEIEPIADVREITTGFLSRKRTLVINADHPTVGSLVALAQGEPEMAAYTFSKLFFLGDRLDNDLDGQLAKLALEHRDARLGAR